VVTYAICRRLYYAISLCGSTYHTHHASYWQKASVSVSSQDPTRVNALELPLFHPPSSLIVSRTRLSTVRDRAFPVAAARVWNSLLDLVTSAPSVAVFRSRLKTHLFNISYPSPCDCTVPAQWRLVALDTIIVLAYLLTYLPTDIDTEDAAAAVIEPSYKKTVIDFWASDRQHAQKQECQSGTSSPVFSFGDYTK